MRRLKKKLSLFLSFTLLMVQIIWSPFIRVQAITATSILNDTQVTLDKAQEWARNNQATSTFIDIAKLYWELAPQHGGVDPALAYAQAAKESGFGRFHDGIDESYHNPIMIKSAVGDLKAFQRFSTWQDGISAHLDHLALYAGAEGYPKIKETLDPIHDEDLLGTVKTIEGLSNTWSQSSNYGEELVSMINTMNATILATPLKNVLVVESPSTYNLEKNVDLDIKGYALNSSNVKLINVYLDNKIVGSTNTQVERKDLEKQFSSYPNNSFSGFEFKINSSLLTVGKHLINVEALGYNGTKENKLFEINIKELPNIFKVENAMPDDVSNTKLLKVEGWALSVQGVEKINIYINDKVVQSTLLNLLRQDIVTQYTNYPVSDFNAFKTSVNLDEFNEGQYKVKIEAVYKDGTSLSEVKDLNIVRKVAETPVIQEVKIQPRSLALAAAPPQTMSGRKLIVLDPGHGGTDSGAVATHNGIVYQEAKLNLNMAYKVKQKLESYGYEVQMTRTQDYQSMELSERTDFANARNPIFFLSIHHDSFTETAKGSSSHYSTYRPNIDTSGLYVSGDITYDSTPSQPAVESEIAAKNLANAMASVGFTNRGARDHNLYVTRNTNMASVLVECGFITSPIDILMITNPFKQELMAQNIASTIKNQYGEPVDLPPDGGTQGIAYKAHVEDIGWQNWVENGELSGTEGKSKRVESLKILAQNIPGVNITYRAHVQDIGWQNWVKDGELAGTTGKSKRIEALEIKLEGSEAYKYNIQYQAHVQDIGWQNWVKDGNTAGTTGKSKRIEAIRIEIIPKVIVTSPGVSYQGHVESIGWQSWTKNGELAGTVGKGLRLEGLNIKLENAPSDLNITYRAHVQDIGWQNWVSNGQVAGTTGKSLKIEAIEIKLTGANASNYSVEYQAHVQDIGWQPLVRDGEISGTTGKNKRMEAVRIQIVRK